MSLSAVILAAALVSGGCANARLYDENRAKLAAETRQKYAQADIPGILDVEGKNLDVLLGESIKVARDNHSLQLDLALLSIAADRTPMADSVNELASGLERIGFSVKDGDFSAVRSFITSQSEQALRTKELQLFEKHIVLLVRAAPPPCELEKALPTPAVWSNGLKIDAPSDADKAKTQESAKRLYQNYMSACEKVKKEAEAARPDHGLLKESTRALQDAKQAKAQRMQEAASKKQELATARNEYQKALGDGKSPEARCHEQEAKLTDAVKTKLGDLRKVIDAADKLDASVASDERIKALLVLLEAASGESISTADPELESAARIAQELPSLLGDMCELMATRKKPPVGNLLLALRHATLLMEYAQQQNELADLRIALLAEQQGLVRAEIVQWQAFLDAVCSFAVLGSKGAHPGPQCSRFKLSSDGKSCALAETMLSGECALSQPWSTHLKAAASPATTQLYKALLAYQRVYALRARASEIDFRLVDAFHREILARKRFAVRDWDNLVGSAVAQLDAYFSAGLKPAEIADLIVKALGFTAIAIGVSK